MPSAARLPSATASTTSRPPLTQSPPAKYCGFGSGRWRGRSTTRPSSNFTLRQVWQKVSEARIGRWRGSPCRRRCVNSMPGTGSSEPWRLPHAREQQSRASMAAPVRRAPDRDGLRPPEKAELPPDLACSYSKAKADIVVLAAAIDEMHGSAPRRLAALAASMAVLPAPTTTTLRPTSRIRARFVALR